ncbi:YceI family protein [Chitinophaga sp. CF118]|uniref:YceI family protein n=1 Tax=Chitinophaga sp. CF118 TaxID=1884367 RepID=UPI000B7F03C0|nr:YceI family protein [Chitinophaga sp. CF118]
MSFTSPPDVMLKWVVLKGSTLRVDGSTNLNKFSCLLKDYESPDTLLFYQNNDKNLPVFMSGSVRLPVLSFDCMSGAMTEGLRKALNAKEFPRLKITFLSLKKYPALKTTEEVISGIVYIEMAGTSKKVEVNYRICMDNQQVIHLVGKQTIAFTDFGLAPPRKLGGIIRADDQLDIEFNLNFKTILL